MWAPLSVEAFRASYTYNLTLIELIKPRILNLNLYISNERKRKENKDSWKGRNIKLYEKFEAS